MRQQICPVPHSTAHEDPGDALPFQTDRLHSARVENIATRRREEWGRPAVPGVHLMLKTSNQ